MIHEKILLLIGIFLITGCQVKEANTIQKIDKKEEVAIADEKTFVL
ncbi:hypothetical protein IZY60_06770 [Lutibacter sp. B2]|nr:hypothetical protein [Lutibacter sp. B2]